MSVAHLMSFDNPVFRTYAFYVGVLALKMLAMSLLTGRMRFKKLVSSKFKVTHTHTQFLF